MKIESQARAEVRFVLPEGVRVWSAMLLDQKCDLTITATADTEQQARNRIAEACGIMVRELGEQWVLPAEAVRPLPEDYAETAQ